MSQLGCFSSIACNFGYLNKLLHIIIHVLELVLYSSELFFFITYLGLTKDQCSIFISKLLIQIIEKVYIILYLTSEAFVNINECFVIRGLRIVELLRSHRWRPSHQISGNKVIVRLDVLSDLTDLDRWMTFIRSISIVQIWCSHSSSKKVDSPTNWLRCSWVNDVTSWNMIIAKADQMMVVRCGRPWEYIVHVLTWPHPFLGHLPSLTQSLNLSFHQLKLILLLSVNLPLDL